VWVPTPATAHGSISRDRPAGPPPGAWPAPQPPAKEATAVNAHDATLTEPATAHTGSTAHNQAPNVPASGGFGKILAAAASGVLGSRALHADRQRDRPDLGQPAVAAADPAPGFRCGQPLGNSAAPAPTRAAVSAAKEVTHVERPRPPSPTSSRPPSRTRRRWRSRSPTDVPSDRAMTTASSSTHSTSSSTSCTGSSGPSDPTRNRVTEVAAKCRLVLASGPAPLTHRDPCPSMPKVHRPAAMRAIL
jgi:hypothetical protein